MPTSTNQMTRAARKGHFQNSIVIATATLQAKAFVDYENDLKITGLYFVYEVASNTGTHQAIEVGTAADFDLYFTGNATNSSAIGSVESKTLLTEAVLPAGTALFVRRANTSSATNVGVVGVIVTFERIENAWRV
jgi:hypothetical protein